MTTQTPLACPKCRADLKDDLAPPGAPRNCPACARPLEGLIFPAYYRPIATGKAAETLIAMEDAGCFYHPQSRAQVHCDLCGRFLCALCDVELVGQHLCPACVNARHKKKQSSQFDSDRMLYGGVACLVAIVPIFVWPFTIITGPLAVFLAIWGWRKPRSVTGSGQASLIIALLIGLIECGLWGLGLVGLFHL